MSDQHAYKERSAGDITARACVECLKAPIYCRERCRRCYSRARSRKTRAAYPMATCAGCNRWRPIQRRRWCEACVTRWQGAGRPDSGPPPLNPDAVRAARAAGAGQARAAKALYDAIRQGGWEWASAPSTRDGAR